MFSMLSSMRKVHDEGQILIKAKEIQPGLHKEQQAISIVGHSNTYPRLITEGN